MGFLSVLFSIKGRIPRSTFWLRGILPLYLISIVLSVSLAVLQIFVLVPDDPNSGLEPPISVNLAADTTRAWLGTGHAEVEIDAFPDPSAEAFEETIDYGFAVGRLDLAGAEVGNGRAFLGSFRWERHPVPADAGPAAGSAIMGLLMGLVMAALSTMSGVGWLWCSIAIGAKRCHDRGRSGWYQLIGLIPLLGALWLFVDLGLLKGNAGENRFGPDPLGGETDSEDGPEAVERAA